MIDKATLKLGEETPDKAAIRSFLTVMFGAGQQDEIEAFSKLLNLVYDATRKAGVIVYQDSEAEPYLKNGRKYAAVLDETCGRWIVIVPCGSEYSGAMEALQFISNRQGGEPTG